MHLSTLADLCVCHAPLVVMLMDRAESVCPTGPGVPVVKAGSTLLERAIFNCWAGLPPMHLST